MVCDLLLGHSLALLACARHWLCINEQWHHVHAAFTPIAMPDRIPRQRMLLGVPRDAALQYAPALPEVGQDRR